MNQGKVRAWEAKQALHAIQTKVSRDYSLLGISAEGTATASAKTKAWIVLSVWSSQALEGQLLDKLKKFYVY